MASSGLFAGSDTYLAVWFINEQEFSGTLSSSNIDTGKKSYSVVRIDM
jgi:hypothetical protein